MWCMKCDKDLGKCICPDLEQRLESLKNVPHVALRWCKGCGKYADRCVCKDGPTTALMSQGREIIVKDQEPTP